MTQTNHKPTSYGEAKDIALVLLKAYIPATADEVASAVQRAMIISEDPRSVDTKKLVKEIYSELNISNLVIKETPPNGTASVNPYLREETQNTFPFEIDKQYRRRDVYRIIGISEDTKGGNWDTGYSSHGNDWFIFCNIGTPGRTGHDYENAWQGKDLLWFGKLKTHFSQPAMQSMLKPKGKTYIFTRLDSSLPFTFAGCGIAKSHQDTSPVTILWELSSP
jgi:hypothetical protein